MNSDNNRVLTNQLVEHLGLSADPFLSSDVFFEGAQRQHNLETLKHLSLFGDMVLLVTGEKGAGKTTLIKQFEKHSDGLNVLYVSCGQAKGAERSDPLVKRLAEAAEVKVAAGETTKQVFSRVLQQLQEIYDNTNERSVIVFDDADLLPKKELQYYFSSLKVSPETSGVIGVFTGLPSLLQKARLSCEFDEEWLHQIQLKPLGVGECLEYVQLRLESVNFEGVLELAEGQLAHLSEVGKGLPGRINRMFGSVLLEPASIKVDVGKSSRVPFAVYAVVGILLFGSFLFVAYQYGLFGEADISQGDKIAQVPESQAKEVISDDKVGQNAQKAPSIEDIREKQKQARLKMLDQAISESMPAMGESQSTLVESDANNISNNTNDIGVNTSQVSTQKLSESDIGDREGVAGTNLQLEANDQTAAIARVQETDKRALVNGEVSDGKGGSNDAQVDQKNVDIVPDPSLLGFYRSKEWASKVPSGSYAAQVLGSHNEKTAVNFADKISKAGVEVYYLKTLYKGKDWYVVFYGVFESKAAAQKALKKAPASIKKQQPWLRSFDAILKSYPK